MSSSTGYGTLGRIPTVSVRRKGREWHRLRVLNGAFYAELCDIDPRYGNALVNEGLEQQALFQNWYVFDSYLSLIIANRGAGHHQGHHQSLLHKSPS